MNDDVKAGVIDFERPIIELEKKIHELKNFTVDERIDLDREIAIMQDKLDKLKSDTYANLTSWQRVQVSRHPTRPYFLDYVRLITSDFIELHGDRCFGDDKALLGGLAKIDGHKVLILGHQKGRDIKENVLRNFGCAHPEGYRKALRLMKLAEKHNLPIISLIDTPGAYPGIGAEERGQAESIARNLLEMSSIKVPILVYVIGEGGSGGALGIGIGDVVIVMENAYYSVISPEGCAAILWKDRAKAADAARVLKLTAKELKELDLIDEILDEPLGGAHRDHEKAAVFLKSSILTNLKKLLFVSPDERVRIRYEKIRRIGSFEEK
ncbi:acetyl-CoA carboxylase carboxyltransferase subunit alpha [PVC group bacterium]|nr:acetyl-CoA carboxylase carboxyltransferase subunit alpha [PVC group bacterium]